MEQEASLPTIEQQVVQDRVLGEYLPAWCASPHRPRRLDPSLIVPNWSFLTPGLARWFLIAIDEGVVEVSDGGFRCGSSWSEGIFNHGYRNPPPQPPKLRREGFLEIAAVGMLAVRYGWPVSRLRFQSPDRAFDFLAYASDDWDRSEVAIAGEAKQPQSAVERLCESLEVCVARGTHDKSACTERTNHHRKYAGLLKYRPGILWAVGPGAFAAVDPDLVFRVQVSKGGGARLRRTEASELQHEPQSKPARRGKSFTRRERHRPRLQRSGTSAQNE